MFPGGLIKQNGRELYPTRSFVKLGWLLFRRQYRIRLSSKGFPRFVTVPSEKCYKVKTGNLRVQKYRSKFNQS